METKLNEVTDSYIEISALWQQKLPDKTDEKYGRMENEKFFW